MSAVVQFHHRYGKVLSSFVLFSSLSLLSLENVRIRLRAMQLTESSSERLDELAQIKEELLLNQSKVNDSKFGQAKSRWWWGV